MNTDKKELSEAYKELRKIIGVQDLEKWAADNSKAMLEEVKTLIKRATQEGQEAALRYDDFKELDRLFVTREITQEEYENNPQKIAYKAYIGEIQIKVKELDIVCLLQAILPPKNLPAYKRATDAAIKKAEKIIKEIHKETSCSAKTLTFLSGLLIQSITYVTHYVYHQKEHDAFLKGLAAFQKQIDEVMKQVTHPLQDEKNDLLYKEHTRITNEMDKLSADHIQTIYNYSKANRIAADIVSELYPEQQIEKSIILKKGYIPTIHGTATDAIARMSSRTGKFNNIAGTLSITNKDVKLLISKFDELAGTLGINTHKLLSVAVAQFTANNNIGRNEPTQTTKYEIDIPVIEYALQCGYDVIAHTKDIKEEQEKEVKRANNALKDFKKRIAKEMQVLRHSGITWKDDTGDYVDVAIIGTNCIRNNYIHMAFDVAFAKYLRKLALTQYPISLLSIDARNSNAYNIGFKMSLHFNMDNNQNKGTANRLAVQTLLNCTNLPNIETVNKNRNSWEDRIKEPFEKALDTLTQYGVLEDWRYSHTKGSIMTDEEATSFNTFEKWAKTLICFSLKNAPDHTERLKAREKEKKENKTKQKNRQKKS